MVIRRSLAIVPFMLSDTKTFELVGEGGNLLFVVAFQLRVSFVGVMVVPYYFFFITLSFHVIIVKIMDILSYEWVSESSNGRSQGRRAQDRGTGQTF